MIIRESTAGLYETEFILQGIETKTRMFDLTAKFWSSMRKRLQESTGLNVVAMFDTRNVPIIRCTFLASRLKPDGSDYGEEEFEEKIPPLKKELESSMDIFLEALEDFKKSPEFKEYRSLVKKASTLTSDARFHEVVNRYLLRIGLKNPEDHK